FHNHLPVRDLKPVNTSHSTVRKAQSENRSRKHMEDDGMKAALRATYSRSSCTAVTPRSNSRPCWSADERRRGSRRLLKSRATRPRPTRSRPESRRPESTVRRRSGEPGEAERCSQMLAALLATHRTSVSPTRERRVVSTGGRERLDFDLRAALHDDRV